MFRCILCLKTLGDAAASREHVFPQAIGGVLTLREMCVPCNSHLGEVIDAPLVNHGYMRWSRRNLKLAERSGKIPNPLERVVVPETGQRARWELDGRVYFHPQLKHENGRFVLVVDETDERRLPEMLEKVRTRRGVEVRGEVIRPGDDFSISFELDFDDERYRFGILKIAYELGCKVLGPNYLADPIAAQFRSVLAAEVPSQDVLASAKIVGRIGGLHGPATLPVAQHRNSWLTGVVFPSGERVHAYVRLFDRFDGIFVLTEGMHTYSCPGHGRGWVTDVLTGEIRDTNIEELRALANPVSDEPPVG